MDVAEGKMVNEERKQKEMAEGDMEGDIENEERKKESWRT